MPNLPPGFHKKDEETLLGYRADMIANPREFAESLLGFSVTRVIQYNIRPSHYVLSATGDDGELKVVKIDTTADLHDNKKVYYAFVEQANLYPPIFSLTKHAWAEWGAEPLKRMAEYQGTNPEEDLVDLLRDYLERLGAGMTFNMSDHESKVLFFQFWQRAGREGGIAKLVDKLPVEDYNTRIAVKTEGIIRQSELFFGERLKRDEIRSRLALMGFEMMTLSQRDGDVVYTQKLYISRAGVLA